MGEAIHVVPLDTTPESADWIGSMLPPPSRKRIAKYQQKPSPDGQPPEPNPPGRNLQQRKGR